MSDEESEKALLEEIRGWIDDCRLPDDPSVTEGALEKCLDLISRLRDENESLWFMLDEMKNSKWSAQHTEMLQESINEHMGQLRMMQGRKADA
ncbi:MAG TPA: hypothetical protein EYG51_22140 [Pseudomonadales bacterium]|nr:hypothetical protein [Pseudomonadales bacterium]